jgi:hypothetical protein
MISHGPAFLQDRGDIDEARKVMDSAGMFLAIGLGAVLGGIVGLGAILLMLLFR